METMRYAMGRMTQRAARATGQNETASGRTLKSARVLQAHDGERTWATHTFQRTTSHPTTTDSRT
jgi:hypothetical protein